MKMNVKSGGNVQIVLIAMVVCMFLSFGGCGKTDYLGKYILTSWTIDGKNMLEDEEFRRENMKDPLSNMYLKLNANGEVIVVEESSSGEDLQYGTYETNNNKIILKYFAKLPDGETSFEVKYEGIIHGNKIILAYDAPVYDDNGSMTLHDGTMTFQKE